MMLKSWSSIEEVPYCFPRSSVKFQCDFTRGKYRWFWAELSVSGLSLQFEFTDGFEIIYKAWISIEEVPCCLSKSLSNFKVTQDRKSQIFTQIEHFWTITAVWIHQWVWNGAQRLAWYRRGALLFFEVIHQIWRSHGPKNWWFESNFEQNY